MRMYNDYNNRRGTETETNRISTHAHSFRLLPMRRVSYWKAQMSEIILKWDVQIQMLDKHSQHKWGRMHLKHLSSKANRYTMMAKNEPLIIMLKMYIRLYRILTFWDGENINSYRLFVVKHPKQLYAYFYVSHLVVRHWFHFSPIELCGSRFCFCSWYISNSFKHLVTSNGMASYDTSKTDSICKAQNMGAHFI